VLDGFDLAEVAAGTCEREMVFNHFDGFGFLRGLDDGACEWESDVDAAAYAIYTAIGERYKYAYSAGDGREFLFDRVADLQETHNCVDASVCREDLLAMREAMIGELRAAGRTEGLAGDGWREFPNWHISPDADAGLLIQDHSWAKQAIPGYSE